MKKYFITYNCSIEHKEYGDINIGFVSFLESENEKGTPELTDEIKQIFANTMMGLVKVERLYFVHVNVTDTENAKQSVFTVQ